jgi:hypothetical protein
VVIATSAPIATVIASSPATVEAMATPAVPITPVCPGTYTEENAVIKITRPVITTRGATIWRIAVIAEGTGGRWPTNADRNLCLGCGCQY